MQPIGSYKLGTREPQGRVFLGTNVKIPEAQKSSCVKVEPAGLAIPLANLTGGRDPAPQIFINSTNALNGDRVWFSNDDKWRTQFAVTPSATIGTLTVTVGEAILHGARFPVISPTGRFPPKDHQTLLLVDGGYADNSGATTLFRQFQQPGDSLWININGNPIESLPKVAGPREANKSFTPIRGLLAVRTSQATNAIQRVIDSNPNFCPLSIAMERSDTTIDACKPLVKEPSSERRSPEREKNRLAPLGWFITQKTAEGMDCALVQAVERLCARVGCPASTEAWTALAARKAACNTPAALASSATR